MYVLINGGHFFNEDRNTDEKAAGNKHTDHFINLSFNAMA
jgi:hypothetical protein